MYLPTARFTSENLFFQRVFVRARVSTNQKVVLKTCLVMWTTQLVFTSISAEVCKMFVLLSQHDSVATVGNADTKLGICVLGSKL